IERDHRESAGEPPARAQQLEHDRSGAAVLGLERGPELRVRLDEALLVVEYAAPEALEGRRSPVVAAGEGELVRARRGRRLQQDRVAARARARAALQARRVHVVAEEDRRGAAGMGVAPLAEQRERRIVLLRGTAVAGEDQAVDRLALQLVRLDVTFVAERIV